MTALASLWCSLVKPHPLNVRLFLFALSLNQKLGTWNVILTIYLHIHPTKRASKADGIKFGCSFVPAPRLNTFMSNGSSLPAWRASSSRFSIPVAWSNGSLITKSKQREKKRWKSINKWEDPVRGSSEKVIGKRFSYRFSTLLEILSLKPVLDK